MSDKDIPICKCGREKVWAENVMAWLCEMCDTWGYDEPEATNDFF